MICWEETFKKYGYYRALVRQKDLVIIKCDICSFIKEVKWLNSRESGWTNWRCKSCISRGLWENANYKLLNGKAISKAQFLRSKTISDSSKKLWSNDDYRNRISDSVKKSNISKIVRERWNSGTYDKLKTKIKSHKKLKHHPKVYIAIFKQIASKIIDFKQLVIKQINYYEASNFIELYHYSKTHRGSTNFGISLNDEIIAVCSFSTIIRLEVAKRLNIKHSEILELSRFCIHPDFHIKNLASYTISKCVKLIKKSNPLLKFLVSFADATYGHSGIIYKATNWKLDGIVRPDYWYEDNDGNKWHKKTIWLKAKSEGSTEKPYYVKHNLKKIIGRHKYRYILKF